MTFGIDFARLRRGSGPALVDPATMSLSLYLAQRGDGLDYTTATGTWTGRPSAGTSGGRNLSQPTAGSRRAVSPAVDGKPLVRTTYVDGKTFANLPGTAADHFTTTAAAGCMILRVGTNSLGFSLTPYPVQPLIEDVNQFAIELAAGAQTVNPSLVSVGVGRYSGSWTSSLKVIDLPADTLMAMCWRHAGGKLQLAVNAAPSAANEIACGAVTNLTTALRILTSSNTTNDVAAIYLGNALSDADFTNIIAWERAQFPTGFP